MFTVSKTQSTSNLNQSLASSRAGGASSFKELSRYASSASAYQNSLGQLQTYVQEKVKSALESLTPAQQKAIRSINIKLKFQGKANLDYAKVQAQVRSILENGSLDGAAKKRAIEDLGKSVGLSRDDMKRVFTDRFQEVYRASSKFVEKQIAQQQKQLSQELGLTQRQFGVGSREFREVKNKQKVLTERLDTQRQRFQDHAEAAKASTKKPSFWSKLGNAFKSIGKVFFKILQYAKPFLAMIPGYGQIAAFAITCAETVVATVKSKGKNIYQPIAKLFGSGEGVENAGKVAVNFFSQGGDLS